MSFRKTWLAAVVVATTIGCGNYSNEDLEFMNALPERQDLTAAIPARSAILIGTADLYRMTRNVALVFNGISEALLTVIDTIRAYPPTTRQPNGRIWGPFPAVDGNLRGRRGRASGERVDHGEHRAAAGRWHRSWFRLPGYDDHRL